MNKLYVVMPVINCIELTQAAIDSLHSFDGAKIVVIDNNSDDGTERWGNTLNGQKLLNNNELIYIRNNERKSVAASWNQGVKLAFEDPTCEYVAILNNDIVLHPKTIDHMRAFMDKTGYLMTTGDNIKDRMSIETMLRLELPEPFTDFDTWKISDWRAEGPDFSCFLINRETIRVIGWFDENFIGAYCEDQDYHARSMMARKHTEQHNDQGIDANKIHFKRLSTAPYFHYASQTVARNINLRPEISLMHSKNMNYYTRKFGADHPNTMDGNGYAQPFGDASKNWRDC